MRVYPLRHLFDIILQGKQIINPTKKTHVKTFEKKVQILVIQSP
jgi:hypothetical protein